MTPEDRLHVAERLLVMQKTLRDVLEACEAQARVCDAAGAKALAFAVHMVREALASYSTELNRFVAGVLADDDQS